MQADVITQARQLIAQEPLYLDTETTGLGSQAEIIEIGIIDHQGAVLLDTFVRPFGGIELDAFKVHGITQDMVANSLPWIEVWSSVETLLEGRMVGIYNREFDLRLMRQSHQRNWMPWRVLEANFFCIMELYARYRGEWNIRRKNYRFHSLESASRQSHIHMPQTHRAIDDARLARALLHFMAGVPA